MADDSVVLAGVSVAAVACKHARPKSKQNIRFLGLAVTLLAVPSRAVTSPQKKNEFAFLS